MVVLNSPYFFEKARPYMEQHEAIRLYLDKDAARRNGSQYALSLSDKYKDESYQYTGHKDLNEWVVNTENKQRKHFRLKL